MGAKWRHWDVDDKWTGQIFGYHLCVARLEESNFRWTLFEFTDNETLEPTRWGFTVTLGDAQQEVEKLALSMALVDD